MMMMMIIVIVIVIVTIALFSATAVCVNVQGERFSVDAGSLGFSVVLFCIGAVCTVVILLLRRFVPSLGRAELGGPVIPKYICGSLLFLIWFSYILLSSLQAYGHIKVSF